MDLRKIELVQASFERVKPEAARTATLFYQRVFEINPSLRPLFKRDLSALGAKFIEMLTFLITGLHQPESIIAGAKALGIRHVGYGAQGIDYHTMGAALLWALEQSLGEDFTPEVNEAWQEAYYVIAGLMKEAAESTDASP